MWAVHGEACYNRSCRTFPYCEFIYSDNDITIMNDFKCDWIELATKVNGLRCISFRIG